MNGEDLILGMIVKNDAKALAITLPVVAPCFRHKFALDYSSVDNTIDLLESQGFTYRIRAWENNYSFARNDLIRLVENSRCHGNILMLDADEAMFREDIEKLKPMVGQHDVIALRRWNFMGPELSWERWSHPDLQVRCFQISKGFHYRNAVHETLREKSGQPAAFHDSGLHIFHYGSAKPPKQVWLKHHNYGRIQEGLPPLEQIPLLMAEMTEDEFYNAVGKPPKGEPWTWPHPVKWEI